jgi:predicted Zn-dependent peptidase
MTEKNATDFYKLYYRPNNAMIVVVGDVNYDQVKSTIAKYYEKIPAQPIPATAIQPELPQVQASRKTLSLNTQVEKIVIAYKVPGDPMEVAPPFEVLASLLTAGRSARLPKLLVDSGLATSVESELVRGIDTSIFLIYATLQAKKKAAHAEAMILSELSAIAKGMISASELDRSKNQLVFSFYQSLSSNAAMARFIGTSEFVGKGVEAELQMVERARAVNINQIQKNVENFLKPTARTVIVGVPK